jgi:hypothetical protein
MNFQKYLDLTEEILNSKKPLAPYDDPDYLNYTKLNLSRMKRWLKTGVIDENLEIFAKKIVSRQNWILISEPWCGDASHIVPFIDMISKLSDKIDLKIQLRDSDSEIDKYLTHGGKSIPMLIIRNENGEDLAIWGPRPKECQEIFQEMKSQGLEFEQQKVKLQEWYNNDKGQSLQLELLKVLENLN